jgi:hypothetical protein
MLGSITGSHNGLMVPLEDLQTIFELGNVQPVVGIEIAESEVLGDLLFLLEHSLYFGSTPLGFNLHFPHSFMKFY